MRPFLSGRNRRIPLRYTAAAIVAAAVLIGGISYIYWSIQPASVEADGRVDANSAEVVATVNGRVALLAVEEGDDIERGAAVAWVSNSADGSMVQLTSPLRGRVTTLDVRQDENVVAGTVLAEIYELDSLVVSLEVNENNIDEVRIGQPVELAFGSLGIKTTSRVSSIALTPLDPDPTESERTRKIREYVVKSRLEQPDPRLLVGMAVRGRIFTDESP